MTAQKKNTPHEALIEQIRVNVAFEQMIVSVLAGAFVGGGLTLLLKLGGLFFAGGFAFTGLITAILETMLVSFLIFLIGFFASVAIGAPLFIALEKRKRRNMWPYLVAALAVAVVSFMAASGGLPTGRDLTIGVLAATFIPALIIAFTFGRLMRPHWDAAARAEADDALSPGASSPTNIVRLH